MTVPDHIQPICGVREWRIADATLYSLVHNHAWVPGVNRSMCEQGHTAPDPDCECGLYAYSDPVITGAYWNLHRWLARNDQSRHPERVWVMGVIEAWGRVEQYETGFRAEYARIVNLVAGDDEDRLNEYEYQAAHAAAERYGVPLIETAPQAV